MSEKLQRKDKAGKAGRSGVAGGAASILTLPERLAQEASGSPCTPPPFVPFDSDEARAGLLKQIANVASSWVGVRHVANGTTRGVEALAIERTLCGLLIAVEAAAKGDALALRRIEQAAVAALPRDVIETKEAAAFDVRRLLRDGIECGRGPRELAELFLSCLSHAGPLAAWLKSRHGIPLYLGFDCDLATRQRQIDAVAGRFSWRARKRATRRSSPDAIARELVIDGMVALGCAEPKARKVFEASEKRDARAYVKRRASKVSTLRLVSKESGDTGGDVE